MKPILQSESAECGLACLAMIAAHHGKHLSLHELRLRFPLSLRGCTLAQLSAMARELGMQSRPLRLELEDLSRLNVPCILHWDMSHFVILVRVARRSITIIDPGMGERRLSMKEASAHFTGIALEVFPAPSFEARSAGSGLSLRNLAGRVSGLGRALLLVFSLSLVLQVCIATAPFLIQLVVDQVLVAADVSLLKVICASFLMLMVLQVGIWWLRGAAVIHLSNSIGLQWSANVFGHLLRLPLDFFEKRNLGDVTSRLGAVQAIQRTLSTSFIEVVIDGFMAAITLVLMLVYSWKLAALTIAAVGLYFVLRAFAFDAIRSGTERQLVASALQQTYLLETIRGVQSIKIAGIEAARESGYLNLLGSTVNKDVKLARFTLGFNTASQLIFGLERIAVIGIGAQLALDSVFSAGMLVAYIAYREQFTQRAGGLIDKLVELRMLRLHGERLADIVLTVPEQDDPRSAWKRELADFSVEAHDVSFRYADGEPWVLHRCSFRIAAGESVAITGPSGCGKTTLVKVMLGLLVPTSGRILVGGVDINSLGRARYREMTAAVMQEDQLFAGSIADNISLGSDDYAPIEVEDAARMAAIHEDISRMPMGYHSLVGDMGTTLSGGQKQRVLLARALFRKPALVFLDEATSHLDIECENKVNSALGALRMTRVMIAHRPQTIASADRILVLDAGAVREDLSAPVATMLADLRGSHESSD